jgi:hypothetical protein
MMSVSLAQNVDSPIYIHLMSTLGYGQISPIWCSELGQRLGRSMALLQSTTKHTFSVVEVCLKGKVSKVLFYKLHSLLLKNQSYFFVFYLSNFSIGFLGYRLQLMVFVWAALNDLYKFDPKTLAWINIIEDKSSTPFPSPRWGVSASSAANRLYIFGGFDAEFGDTCLTYLACLAIPAHSSCFTKSFC